MTRNRNFIKILLFVTISILCSLQTAGGTDKPLSVQAQVDKEKVTVGESIMLQIKIDGDDSPAEPDLSGLQEFSVTPRGGSRNNRESITIINGELNRISEHGYVFQYELMPKKDGTLTIPALEIAAGGKKLLTQPIAIRVAKPVVSDEFRLQITLSETSGYVGQPLILAVKWYVDKNIAEFRFDLPFLDDNRFVFADHPDDVNYQGQDAVTISLPGGSAIARKGQEGSYTTLTLRKIVIPGEPGEFVLERGKVFSKIITGYRQQSPNRSFNGFFDDVFGRRQAVYRQIVTESNELHLEVSALPEKNRPVDFSGLVGQYSLAAEADPTEVNVGDPITLTIMITGGEFLENVFLPPLEKQPDLSANFKLPEEMGQGETDGRVKVFTQTIRAKNSTVKEIPGISLSYFNPETGQYESATANAIPLQVHATNIVTAKDAEGTSPDFAQKELTSLDRGIAHNYVEDTVLENQDTDIISWFGSPFGISLILFPPVAYLLVLVPVYIKRKRFQDADVLQAHRAYSELAGELKNLQKDLNQKELQQTVSGMVEAVRTYLGKRLYMPPGAIIYKEVAERLRQKGIADNLLLELKNILDRCEAYHYGAIGQTGAEKENVMKMLDTVLQLFKKIDTCLKK